MSEQAESAIVAAAQASDALAEILRFAREGAALGQHPFGEAEPVAKLAEAIVRIGEIEIAGYTGSAWAEERQMLNQLMGACHRFIDGWTR